MSSGRHVYGPSTGIPGLDCFAPIMTFSSLSMHRDDAWGRDLKRPYQIVLLPGHTTPRSLDKNCRDAIWVEGVVTEPVVVWDGFDREALFEVIYECMSYEGPIPTIRVWDREEERFVEDPRDPEILAARPPRKAIMHVDEYRPRWKALQEWTARFGVDETGRIYDVVGGFAQSKDTHHRKFHWNDRNMNAEKCFAAYDEFREEIRSGKLVIPYRRGPRFPVMLAEKELSDARRVHENRESPAQSSVAFEGGRPESPAGGRGGFLARLLGRGPSHAKRDNPFG